MIDLKQQIKILLATENVTMTSVAEKLGTQSQNISNKLTRGTMNFVEAQDILDVLGYEFKIEKKS